MKKITTLFITCLMAVSFAHAESAAGVSDSPAGETAQGPRGQKPGPKGKADRPSREQMLAKFDTDGDGTLNEQEREAAREARIEHMALKRFDADGDGKLNADEQNKADAFRAEREAKMLAKFDADGDGTLSDTEKQQARKQMQRRVAQGQEGKGPKGGQGQANGRQGPPRSTDLPAGAPPPPPFED